jgi:hypothetical protein
MHRATVQMQILIVSGCAIEAWKIHRKMFSGLQKVESGLKKFKLDKKRRIVIDHKSLKVILDYKACA